MTWPDGRSSVLVREADAEALALPTMLARLYTDSSQTGGTLSVVRATMEPGVDGARPHHHNILSELFFMISGRIDVLVGDDVISIAAGDVAVVAPGVMHAFAAPAGEPADVLIVAGPTVDRFGYFRMLHRVVKGETPPAEIFESQELYDNWFSESAVWAAHRARK
jgi:mannose-6-phosphate isomerase-like protein (cupin superfamily)